MREDEPAVEVTVQELGKSPTLSGASLFATLTPTSEKCLEDERTKLNYLA